jgi:hypothetical protein
MDTMEEALGGGLLMDAAQGRNFYLFAALKSLPLKVDDGARPGSDSEKGAGGGGEAGAAGAAAAAALLARVRELEAECGGGGGLEADEALLRKLEGPGGTGDAGDPRLAAAVQYRLERKRLLQAARLALGAYGRGAAGGGRGGGGGGGGPGAAAAAAAS